MWVGLHVHFIYGPLHRKSVATVSFQNGSIHHTPSLHLWDRSHDLAPLLAPSGACVKDLQAYLNPLCSQHLGANPAGNVFG